MVLGIGTDLLEIKDLQESFLRETDPFVQKSFTKEEIEGALQSKNRSKAFGKLFSAKEAVYKALNRGWQGFSLRDVEILCQRGGGCAVRLHREAKKRAKEKGIHRILVSISCSQEYVFSAAVAEDGEGRENDLN